MPFALARVFDGHASMCPLCRNKGQDYLREPQRFDGLGSLIFRPTRSDSYSYRRLIPKALSLRLSVVTYSSTVRVNQENQTTTFRRFRARSKTLLRDNKLLIATELIIALLITVAYLADYIPLSETPFLFLLGWLSLWLRGIGWRAVGFRRPERWKHTLLLGSSVGVVYQFFSLYVLEPLIIRLTGKSIDLSQFAQIKGNVFVLFVFLVLIWTLAAFGEELVHRGYLMNRVAELAGGSSRAWELSLILVSVLFGVVHLYQGISGVLDTIAAGLVYGALYLGSGRNLWAPIIAHGVYDTVAVLLIFWGKYPGL